MKRILKPIYLILFIIIPQILLGMYLAFSYYKIGEIPQNFLILTFSLHIILNIYVLFYYFKKRVCADIEQITLKYLLVGFIVTFSGTIILLFNKFKGYSGFSPEVVYLLANSLTLLYLTISILIQNKSDNKINIKKQIIICIFIPLIASTLFSASSFYFEFHNVFSSEFYDALLSLSIALFCGFIFYFIRLIYSFCQKKLIGVSENKSELVVLKQSTRYRIFIIIFAVVLPTVGLIINNTDMDFGSNAGIFGNFSNIWFYIIAILNGLLMLINTNDKNYSILLLYLKAIGFSYIIYFTIIFIPIIPYGVIGLVFYGLGIFVFVPAIVFGTELLQIISDVSKLKAKFKISLITTVIILGTITLPAISATNFYVDKVNFNNALCYLNANANEAPPVDTKRLKVSLTHINNVLGSRQRDSVFNNGANIPLISDFYQLVALDGKILSSETVQKLNKIFYGEIINKAVNFTMPQMQNVNLLNVFTQTQFDEKSQVYKTWVDLEIRNDSPNDSSEYITQFSLPDGCFVKDYYLFVGNEKKYGLLTDKRAALITYNNIIRTPKDPGIIYYKNDTSVELRVFPFARSQVRKTGFLIMHTQKEIINIDGKEVVLEANQPTNIPIDLQGINFIPASYKKHLTTISREPIYCFVVDCSKSSLYDEQIKKIKEFSKKNNISNAKVYFASYRVKQTTLNEIDNKKVKTEGGFNLSLAMAKILSEQAKEQNTFPIIIAVTDNMARATLLENNGIFKKFPESEFYYNLNYDLSLTPYSYYENKNFVNVTIPTFTNALTYKNMIIGNNNKSEIVINDDIAGEYTDNEYYNALILKKKSLMSYYDNNKQLDLIRDSFRQKLLTNYSAFIVLETKEQENSLITMQEKFLSGKQLDAPSVMMSEPGLVLCFLLGVLFIIYRRKRLKKLEQMGK